jgi:hypothetical protein
MARDKLIEYDQTAANNTVIGDVNTSETMLPSEVNDAFRELASHLKEFADGTSGINALSLTDDTDTNAIKFQAPASVTATTTFTLPDGDGTNGQIIITDGTGGLSWSDGSSLTGVQSGAGYFQGNNGDTGDTTNGKGDIFRVNAQTLTSNVTIATADNATAAGPLTIDASATLTVNGNLTIL